MSLGRPDTAGPQHTAQPIHRSSAEALRRLLGPELVGALQVGREYPGRIVIDDDTLAAHLAGEIAVALRVGNGKGRSRLLVFDVDARATERIPLLCDELRRRGYGNAVVATGGSSVDRGKVAVFFHREQQNAALRVLGAAVLRDVRLVASWGVEVTSHEITVYPSRGEGGLVRLGGRNIGRNGPLENLHNAWGEPYDFTDVAPVTTRLRAARDVRQPVRTSARQAWVDRAMTDGLTWIAVGGTRGINAFTNRLARETIRTHGDGDAGQSEFRQILEKIAAASPDLVRPSPTNQDCRHPLGWGRRAESAWERNCAKTGLVHTTFSAPDRDVVVTSPVSFSAKNVVLTSAPDATVAKNVVLTSALGTTSAKTSARNVVLTSALEPPRRSRQVYAVLEVVELLTVIVQRRGLNPIAFELSYREGAEMLGISHIAFRKRILGAEACGLIVRVDPGLQGSGGRYTGRPGGGAKTLYALVPAGETPDEIRAKADAHHATIRRRAFVQSEHQRRENLQVDTESATPLLVPTEGHSEPARHLTPPSVNDADATRPPTGRQRRLDRPHSTPSRTLAEIQERIRAIAAEQRNEPP